MIPLPHFNYSTHISTAAAAATASTHATEETYPTCEEVNDPMVSIPISDLIIYHTDFATCNLMSMSF